MPRPKARTSSATTASMAKVGTPRRSMAPGCSCESMAAISRKKPPRPARAGGSLGDEARALHQLAVLLFGRAQPLEVLVAVHGCLVERALFHVVLPLRRRPHLLQEVDVEVHLLLGHARGHEDA